MTSKFMRSLRPERKISRSPSPVLNLDQGKMETANIESDFDNAHEDGEEASLMIEECSETSDPDPSPGLVPVARNQCPHCYVQFALEKNFVEHMFSAHGSRRPFRCDDCGIFLSYRSSLYNHKKIHSDKRPFSCTECSAKFRWNNSLKYHMTRSHQKTAPLSALRVNRPPRRDLSAAVQKARNLHKAKESYSESSKEAADILSSLATNGVISNMGNDSSSSTVRSDVSSLMQLFGMATAAAALNGSQTELESKTKNGQDMEDGASHRKRQAPQRKTITKILEPRKCDGCARKFFLPEALEAHQESCAKFQEDKKANLSQYVTKKMAKCGGPSPVSSASESLVDKTIEEMILSVSVGAKSGQNQTARNLPTQSLTSITGGGRSRSRKRDLNSLTQNGFGKLTNDGNSVGSSSYSAGRNGIAGATIKEEPRSGIKEFINVSEPYSDNAGRAPDLSETLSQICTQQDALMQRLEGFERWVQERVGKMENILNSMVLNGQFIAQAQ